MKKLLLSLLVSLGFLSAQAWTVTFTAPAGWDKVYAYTYSDETLGVWPGTAMNYNTDTQLWSVEGTGSSTNIIFNNGSGQQTANLTLTDGGSYTYFGNNVEIPTAIYVRGELNGWLNDTNTYPLANWALNQTAPNSLIYSGTVSIEAEKASFKIADTNWSLVNYGSNTEGSGSKSVFVYGDKSASQTMVWSGDPFNIANWKGGQLVITVNLLTKEITFVGPDQPDLVYPSKLYLRGEYIGSDWEASEDAVITNTEAAPNIYTGTYTFDQGKAAFKIADATWTEFNFGGWATNVYANIPGMEELIYDGQDQLRVSNWAGGEMNITFNLDTLEVEITGENQPLYAPNSLYLPGIGNNWDNWDGMFTIDKDQTSEYSYTTTISDLAAGDLSFKITGANGWVYETGNWGLASGASFNLYSDEVCVKNLVNNGENITIGNWAGGDLTITVNVKEMTVTIAGSNQPEAPEMEDYNIYVYNGAGWSTVYLYTWGAAGELTGDWPGETSNTTTEVNGFDFITYTVETYEGAEANLIFNNNDDVQFKDLAVTFNEDIYVELTATEAKLVSPKDFVPTGINNLQNSGADAPVEFYNLQGVKVANPQNGVFIRKQGNSVKKIIVR